MIPRSILHFIFCSGLILMFVGCSSTDDLKDLKDKLAEIEQKPKGRIPPPPEFKAFQTFTYQSAGLRSPFEQPVEVIFETKIKAGNAIAPDLQRRKEALERYSLDSMSFVGTLIKEDDGGALWAIIDDGVGGVHRVKEGNYLGQNFGKILRINDRRVEVLEIVPSGQLDDEGNKLWIERPRSLVLRDE
jgi:type IV pilus assembly protein PilP